MKSFSIRTKVTLAAVAVAVVAMAILSIANFSTAQSTAVHAAESSARELGQGYARLLGDWADSKAAVVKSLEPAVTATDALPVLLQAKVAGGYDTTYIAWADKRHAFSSPQNLPADWDPTSRPWYKQAAEAGKLVLTSPYIDAGTKKLVVTFANPVKTGSQTQAVVAGDIFLDHVVNTVKTIKLSPNSFAYLVDSHGSVIAHPDAALALKPAKEVVAGFDQSKISASGQAKSFEKAEVGDAMFWLTAQPVPNTDWHLVMALSEADALAGVSRMRAIGLAVGTVLVVLTGLLLAVFVSRLLKPVSELREALNEIAAGDGDLTRRLADAGNDELSAAGRSFNVFVAKIATTISTIRETSDSVSTAAQQIAVGNQDLSQRTELTATNLQETASSMEQIAVAVRHSAEAASNANQLALSAASSAQRGGDVVSKAVATMSDIHQSSSRIAEIIGVIDGIAFQTNILALNAAVEAARAGEQGRGFAVVASEVRALAQRSSGASKEIRTLIHSSVERISEGNSLVTDAGAVMKEVVDRVQHVSRVVQDITKSASEQSVSIAQVGQAVSRLDDMTQQNAALVEESAAAAQSLRVQAQGLAQDVAGFKLTA